MLIGDLISISRAPAVVSLSAVDAARKQVCGGGPPGEGVLRLLAEYFLGEAETRAGFEAMIRSLGRTEERGDAFVVQGVHGSGKSHLLAVLSLLCWQPKEAWPAFISSHPEYTGAAGRFARPRLVVAVALDEYAAASHSLERIVLSRIEAELAAMHDIRLALTEESHLLDLMAKYVTPQAEGALDELAREVTGSAWRDLCHAAPVRAAEVALRFLRETGFPLDWRRSRSEAWGVLRRTLEGHEIDGPVVLLDELGIFLAGKNRAGLNADAAFLQYLAQRTAGERCWLVCVTQRGLSETGDVDRRTLRQMRDRFRTSVTLDLAEFGWVVENRLVRRHRPDGFEDAIRGVHQSLFDGKPEAPFRADDLLHSYPFNPLCLEAVQRAAAACLSRGRSVIRLLQEGARERGWLDRQATELVTPDAAFDVLAGELSLSTTGRRHLRAYETAMANADSLAPHQEGVLATVMKTLTLLGVGGLRWSAARIRGSLVGSAVPQLWQEDGALEAMLRSLYRRGAGLERVRREGEEGDEYYLDVASETSTRIRQRLNELTAEMSLGDARVLRAALEACGDPCFPLAGLVEQRTLGVDWQQARRYLLAACRDLTAASAAELQNTAGALQGPQTKEDGALIIAPPTTRASDQEQAWREMTAGIEGRFARGLLAWIPRSLTETECDHLIEHAALASMAADPTFSGRSDTELRKSVRERWADSALEVKGMLQRAYYGGRVLGAGGSDAIEPERLSALSGDWEETLSAVFSGAFRDLFPRFGSIRPERRLADRTHVNQLINQFIRPGEVRLPPASTLESHLVAYARPLGLVEEQGRKFRLALGRRDLVADVIAEAPPRRDGDEIDPEEVIGFSELAGRLAKSEWGIVREQSDLLVAGLLRKGYLVALDAFLQPVRLDDLGTPLSDHLPYVMRGAALAGPVAEAARTLWQAARGAAGADWDLSRQELVWSELVAWAGQVREDEETRASLAAAAGVFGHEREEWAWAEQCLGRAQAAARGVEASLTSNAGLRKLVGAAARLPGGIEGTARALASWRACQHFLKASLQELARLHRLLTDQRIRCPADSMLAREHRALLQQFRSSEGLVNAGAEVASRAQRWLESYRKHYLAWHARAHAPRRFEALRALRQSPAMAAARRLAAVGVGRDEVEGLDSELSRALASRCLAGDPLPAGRVVCPICGLALGEEVVVPEAGELEARAQEALARQREELAGHSDLLQRRLSGCAEERVRSSVERLVGEATAVGVEELQALLTDDVTSWMKRQVAQPRAKRRRLDDLARRLRGRDLTKRDAARVVEEWLSAGDDDIIEIV